MGGSSATDETTTSRGWLSHLVSSSSAGTHLNLGLRYDATGNVQTSTGASDLEGPAFTNTYTYDSLDRLHTAHSSIVGQPTGLFPDQTDPFDAFGRLQSRTLAGTAYAFQDDPLHAR